jgi:magnesium-transporting ATPase (P-type)
MVVLYTFYKNAVMGFILVLYNHETLFSGTSIFDQWVMSGYSFVCFFPILSIGMFDRNLQKSYIKNNPEVYKPTRQNEIITPRTLCRWSFITIIHTGLLYYGQLYQLTQGGADTSAFMGLMNNGRPIGDGQIADWQSLGTTVFTSMVLLMGYKVMYESRSIINGKWPAFIACFKETKEGFLSRIPFTWIGVIYLSFGCCGLCFFLYHIAGLYVAPSNPAFRFIFVASHVFQMSSTSYAIIFFIPLGAMALDVSGKVFSNMFYPSQNQIHIELEAKQIQHSRNKRARGVQRSTEVGPKNSPE